MPKMDKEFLDRIKLAIDFYKKSVSSEPVDLDAFMKWLYSQYGMLPPEKR